MKNNREIWVYDIETLFSCFTYSAINIDTEEVVQYVIHKDRNDIFEFIHHLKHCKGHIGFNNVGFDYPVIHYLLCNYRKWINCISPAQNQTASELVTLLYDKAQGIISNQDLSPFGSMVPEKDVKIFQLDLFKVWHYNNKARSTSLKALEISMNYPNVMEMPIEHTKEDITLLDVESILEYNLNDVLATYEFYKKTIQFDKIELRKSIMNKYGLPCLNWNNGKIGENLILKLYCDKTGQNPWEVKKMRSHRSKIDLKECIPSNISFKSEEFNKLLDYFKGKTITETKGSVDIMLVYKGLAYYYGTGGLHAAIKSGIYESDDEYIIKTCDVASLYPWLPIIYNFYIEHLGPEFLEVYRDNIVQVRLNEKMKPKGEQDKAIVDGYKEAANIPYGKSNDINSFLYDPLYSMKTTIAGQLVISMLAESLAEIPNSQILMVNTDGLEIKIPRKHCELYDSICKEWENITKLTLEFDEYQKMWIGDINNYGCISVKGKTKNKGRFEVDKVIGNEPAYHKDNSFRVVKLALQEYFVNNVPVEDTIMKHVDIYDFCGRQKFTRDSNGMIRKLSYDEAGNPVDLGVKQQKNVRYYISLDGDIFYKYYSKGTTEVINKGYKVTVFNKFVNKNWPEYDIDYSFYIKECYKEIDNIITKQLSLF